MSFRIQGRVRQKTEEAEAIVQRNDNDRGPAWPARGQLAAVVVIGFAINISAAVDPDEHRKSAATEPRREDVEIEAVLCDARRRGKHRECGHLRASICKRCRIERILPMRHGLRRPPAQRTRWGSGVWDAFEFVHTIIDESAHGTLGSSNYRSILPVITSL